jgi:hypothetical protein
MATARPARADQREEEVLEAVRSQDVEEAGAGLIADGEDEQGEADGLGPWGHAESEVAEEEPGKQHAGHGTEREAADPDVPDQVSHPDDQKQGQHRLLLKELIEVREVLHGRDLGGASARALARIASCYRVPDRHVWTVGVLRPPRSARPKSPRKPSWP